MNKLTTALVSLTVFAACAASAAPKLGAASVEAAANFGGNYVITVNGGDFTATTAGTNTFTNTFTAPVSVRFVGWKLVAPFSDAKAYATNGSATTTNSVIMNLGDAGSATRWVSAVQVAYDSTPTVYGAFGTPDATVTITATSAVPVAVNAPAYDSSTSNVSVISKFTFPGGTDPATITRGSVQFYFKAIGKTY